MATLIPALGACLPRMTPGEKRLAERREEQAHSAIYLCLVWRFDQPAA